MSDDARSLYDELDVPASASTAEIRIAYLALARRHHPDRTGDVEPTDRARSAARMARVNAAWNVLSDPRRRAHYDATRNGAEPGPKARSNVRDPGDTFRPFADEDDDVDPRLLDDTPTGAPTMHRSLAFVPAGLAAAGLVLCVLGAMLGFMAILVVGIGAIVGSGVAFLLVPLVAMVNSSRADGDP